jgi:hypothetical protein
MAFEEKRAWMMVVVTVAAYGIYLSIVLGRLSGRTVTDVPYARTMLLSIGGAIVASIVAQIVISTFSARHADRKDVRDREIGRFGDHIGQSFVVIGGVSALLMAMAEWDYFWIANVIYLCFALSSVLGSIAKIAAYRWGFQPW